MAVRRGDRGGASVEHALLMAMIAAGLVGAGAAGQDIWAKPLSGLVTPAQDAPGAEEVAPAAP